MQNFNHPTESSANAETESTSHARQMTLAECSRGKFVITRQQQSKPMPSQNELSHLQAGGFRTSQQNHCYKSA